MESIMKCGFHKFGNCFISSELVAPQEGLYFIVSVSSYVAENTASYKVHCLTQCKGMIADSSQNHKKLVSAELYNVVYCDTAVREG